ncbi:MAG TPA: HEAT repeat domain-containing protein, partial [Xanthobacteraceae bacterium]|nr:HEAT repeat domain-containing protein [Xanthobacteraceae bacterium]
IPSAVARLDDESPLVRGAAVWALSQLDPDGLRRLSAQRAPDPSPEVREEWSLALAERAAQ